MTEITVNAGVPAIPETPNVDPEMRAMLDALKEGVEVLAGIRGDGTKRALTVGEATEDGDTELFQTNISITNMAGSQDSVRLTGDVAGTGLFDENGAVVVPAALQLPNIIVIDGGAADTVYTSQPAGPYGIEGTPAGGTTGQVFGKLSNTDYDYGWITQTDTQEITVQDEGSSVSTTIDTLNFVGDGVVATNAGGGVATITIAGGGGGGAWTQIHQGTPPGTSGNYDVTWDESTYSVIYVEFEGLIPATDGVSVYLQLGYSNGSSFIATTGDYDSIEQLWESTGLWYGGSDTDKLRIYASAGSDANESASGIIEIFGGRGTHRGGAVHSRVYYTNSTSNTRVLEMKGMVDDPGDQVAIDSFRLSLASGNWENAGTITVYGLSY